MALVVNSPNWPKVRDQFFNPDDFREAWPKVVEGFWVDMQMFAYGLIAIPILVLILATARSFRGPAFFPIRLLARTFNRVAYARETRVAVEVLADERGLVTIGKGLGGRTELGLELTGAPTGQQQGRALLRDVLAELPAGEAVWASCSPGNARSLRALLAVGFVPVGAEVILQPVAG